MPKARSALIATGSVEHFDAEGIKFSIIVCEQMP